MLCSASNSYDGCIDPLKIEFNNSFRPAAWEKFPGHLDANWRTRRITVILWSLNLSFWTNFFFLLLNQKQWNKSQVLKQKRLFFKAGKIKKMERNEKYNWAWRWAKFLPTQLKRLVTTLHHQSNIDALKRDADRRPVLLTLNDASRNISSTGWFCCCCCVLNWNNRRKKWLTRGSLAMI